MIEGIEKHYQIIAEGITSAIPEEWTSASLEAIYFSESTVCECEYVRSLDGQPVSIAAPKPARRALNELRDLFRASGQSVWGQAEFLIQSTGRFSMNWGYEDCDKNGDTIFDEEKELARTARKRNS